jgi:hypothetical protein
MTTKHLRRVLASTLVGAALLAATGAQAQLFRAYLASDGLDTNPCTLPQPCRLLPAALTAVAAGGEVWMLDSANFNTSTVAVNKSVTILAVPGALGSIVGGTGGTFTAMTVGAGSVTLRNLVFRGTGAADIAILIGSSGSVTIEGCEIFGFRGTGTNGIGIWADTANVTKVNVIGTTVRDNHHGIIAAQNALVTISKSHIVANGGVGVWSNSGGGTTRVDVSDSVSNGNAVGFAASGVDGATNSSLFVTRSVASNNTGAGFLTSGGTSALLVVGESMATGNAIGFENTVPSTVHRSRGNNILAGNTTSDTQGTMAIVGGN